MIEHGVREMPVTAQVDSLSLNRSGLSSHAQPPSAEEIPLKHRIDELSTKYPFYGSRRITAHVEQEGVIIHRTAVQRHLREMGIEAMSPGPKFSVNVLDPRERVSLLVAP